MTSVFVPNGTVTIVDTGTALDEYGDPVSDGVPVVLGVPALWVERDQRTYDPVSGRTTIVEGYEVRLRPGTEVVEGQRVVLDQTGETGRVVRVRAPRMLGVARDVVVRLERVSR